jgi:urease accessory protein UreE
VEFGENFLEIEADPVLKEMLVRLGVTVREEISRSTPKAVPTAAGTGTTRHLLIIT